MARTRSISNDRAVGRRARDSMHWNRYSHSPIGSSQRTETEPQTSVRRVKSASPGPALITGRTQRKSNGTTPVLPTPSQRSRVWKNGVVKQRARSRSQRGRSKDGDDVSGPSRDGSMVPAQAHEAQEGDKISRALPDLPEDDVISFASFLDTPRSSIMSRRSGSPPNGPIALQTPGPKKSSTQRELEAMDTELVLESTSELDRNAQRLLDLLILNPPEGDMLVSTHTKDSKVSKRLRVYWLAFGASKIVFGTSHFLDVGTVEMALGGGGYTPVIYRANLAILANFIYTANEEDDTTFQELKSIERYFPTQVGGIIDDQSLQFALDLRTQTVIRGMLSVQEDSLEPNMFLKHFFMERVLASEANDGKPEYKCKPWLGSRDVDEWEGVIIERIRSIRSTFRFEGGQNDGEESHKGRVQVDFEKLTALFPWKGFVGQATEFIKGQLIKLDDSNMGACKEQGSSANKKIVDESQQQVEVSLENRDSFDQDTSQISTEVDKVEYSGLSNFEDQTVDNQNPDSQPEPSSQFVGGGSQLNVRAAKLVKRDLLAREALSKGVRANSIASSIVSNPESIATTVAQVNAIKKRKRKSEIMEITNRQEDGEAQSTTPGYAVSETVVNSLAQMKHLKGAKKLLVQQKQSVPAPLPLALGRQELSGDPDDLLSTNQEGGCEFTQVSEGDRDESDGESSDDPGYRAFSELRREQDKENKKRMTPVPLPSPRRRKRLKRFLDPQEGAMRGSPIDEEGVVILTPPIRSDKSRGNRIRRTLGPGEEEQEDEDGDESEEEQEDEGGDESEEQEDEDEDGSEFVPDPRDVREDNVNRSRRHLPSGFRNGSVSSSDSANSPQSVAVVIDNRLSANPLARRGSSSNVALVPANPSHRSQRNPSEEAEGSQAGPLDRRFDEYSHRSLQQVSRINRLAKINRAAVHTQRRSTTFWTEEGTKALMQAIHEYGPSWAVIRDVSSYPYSPVVEH
ncbi:unnamed protein product [Tuber melanosporum]|uniref:(Perigord truffle) hypothetical protein n=1 Tax=Tuber melanosporum (strain Mel28) TaxID=656061 RepID=D5GI23_TUBMM|nr:uncharacterized protein GSTUM_00008237001 [Tuber melanosporum]CAZ84166.1 unnamed protein product [Tuber melanosporum]